MTQETTPGRPRVICHMLTSIDGRIVTAGWPDIGESRREYESVHASYGADAWMCGRVTMEPFAGGVRSADAVRSGATRGGVMRPDFIAPHAASSYAVAVDPSGRLAWDSSEIDGDHVVALLTEEVADEYLEFLRAKGVSYLFAGGRTLDFAHALAKLSDRLGIRTLMLEGGGKINGALLRADLVDEISLLVAPVADGTLTMASLFDVDVAGDPAAYIARKLELLGVERRASGVLWIRYRVER